MVSPVKSRPTHYDILGLPPEASADEIARAFAREMSIAGAQPIGAAAKICAAYETLRNPNRRREYDQSIGIAPKPKPQPQPRQWAFPAPQQQWSPLVASARPAASLPPESDPLIHDPLPQDPLAQRASRIAESLRELARPIEPAPEPRPQPPEVEKPAYSVEPDIRELLAVRSDGPVEEDRGFDWRRPVLAVSGLVVAAGVIGAMAGLWVKGDVDSAQSEPALTVGIPAARAHAAAAPAEPPVEAAVREGRTRAAVPTVRTNRARLPLQLAQRPSVESSTLADNQFVQSATEQAAVQDPLAPAPATAPTVAADLPLPRAVIARTIERIGYSCGRVASANAVEGVPGAFKVTCSSGQSYRAAPVHGRYRFKRLSGG
jgi:hypothetical protein